LQINDEIFIKILKRFTKKSDIYFFNVVKYNCVRKYPERHFNMYKLVIFDLDGTLVNSLEDLGNACNSALEKFGYPVHPMESFRYFVGDGVPMLIRRALPESERTEENIQRVKEVFDGIYGKNYSVCTRPYEGIVELLQKLKEAGILIAVASNKPDNFTQTIVSAMFGDTFSYVSGKKDGFEKKPNPQIALHIMEKLGVSPKETLFAGDSSVDMQTALNAGCDSIGCVWGFRTLKELEDSGAAYIAYKPEDIYGTALMH
jgi:phosphoglycolate phosphatase